MNNTEKPIKPLGQKAYGSIPHLPGSRMGPADHHCHEGQSRICTEKTRDRHDSVYVQEKLDGSCCAVVRLGGELVALGRAGYLAETSNYEQHQLFAAWVKENRSYFDFLTEGERVVGEWLAQAHGTRYKLSHGPFVAFDIMRKQERLPFGEFMNRIDWPYGFPIPKLLAKEPTSIESVMEMIKVSGHGALDPVEGAVWRVERNGNVDFLAKWVRPDKKDGCLLPLVTGGEAVWNWRP